MEEEDYQDYEETQENPEILEATPDLDNGNFKTEQTDSEAVPTTDMGWPEEDFEGSENYQSYNYEGVGRSTFQFQFLPLDGDRLKISWYCIFSNPSLFCLFLFCLNGRFPKEGRWVSH